MGIRIRDSAALVAAFVCSGAVHSACGSGSPSRPTPPVTTPSSTPPTTAPAPLAPPVAASCPLGAGHLDTDCERRSSRLRDQYEAAIERVIARRPELFNLEDDQAPGTRAFRVRDRDAYLEALVASLQAAGLCAERDLDDPAQEVVFVKDSNAFSEEFDTLLASGHVRRGLGAYRASCTPASFPVERPADAPPIGSGCYRPFPPPIDMMICKEHLENLDRVTLDSTALVFDPAYCAEVGFPERARCPVRSEASPEREACEAWRVGRAQDTGRPGPTWRRADGRFCTGPESGCQNTENQHQLWAYRSGTYEVCAQTGRCCEVVVE